MRKYLDDVLIFIGCGILIYATYRISLTAALYASGVLCILAGVFVGITGKRASK